MNDTNSIETLNVALVKVGMSVVEKDGALLEVTDVEPPTYGFKNYRLTVRSMMNEKIRIVVGPRKSVRVQLNGYAIPPKDF